MHSFSSVPIEERSKYLCPDCGKGFQYRHAMSVHQNTFHLNIPVGSCPRCSREFYYKSNFVKHLGRKTCQGPRSRTIEERTLRSTCVQCFRVLSKPGNLRAHINHHHNGIRPFKCSECEKSFTDRRNLAAHQTKRHPGLLADAPPKIEEPKKENI